MTHATSPTTVPRKWPGPSSGHVLKGATNTISQHKGSVHTEMNTTLVGKCYPVQCAYVMQEWAHLVWVGHAHNPHLGA
eukprot:9305553-Alexandrium_andersonii.AAC.1